MKRGERGFSLVEVMVAALLLALVVAASLKAFRFLGVQGVRLDERAFASQKALQMMEELRALVPDVSTDIGVLDGYDNGGGFKYTLSVRGEVNGAAAAPDPADRPADPLSGNAPRGGGWKYKRRVTVAAVPNEELARRVYVRVYRGDADGEPLAETMGVIRTLRNQLYPTQVFDVFVLALENVPGWGVGLSALRPMFDGAVTDLQARNPGLQFRVHYVTRMAYGRDPFYAPALNAALPADAAPPTGVYLYPGKVAQPGGGTASYYVPDAMDGRRSVDGARVEGYSLADQYNHAVRYPDEEAMYAAAAARAREAGAPPPEVSYRMLLERMASSPAVDAGGNVLWDLRNAVVLNLHGELLPLPPMRNYSDAAKDPAAYGAGGAALHGYPRAVTHPERLQYPAGSEVRLRVYTYCAAPSAAPEGARLPAMNVVVKSARAPADAYRVRVCTGAAGGADYAWKDAAPGVDYEVDDASVPGQVKITLFNSPLRHGRSAGRGGLDASLRLYGWEYIPAPLAPGDSFEEGAGDLADPAPAAAKNTARWTISVAAGALPVGRYAVETRIGVSTFSVVPVNLSRTYVWVGDPAPPERLPVTERYQYLGDPRHNPYADVKAAGGCSAYFSTAAFDAAAWPGFGKYAGPWGGGVGIDLPRYFQTVREALVRSHSLWSNGAGRPCAYVGLGGEIGSDGKDMFPDGIPVDGAAWKGRAGGVQEMTGGVGASVHNGARVVSRSDDSWWGRSWLGELFPDDRYADWAAAGNLPAGRGQFYRRPVVDDAGSDPVALAGAAKKIGGPGAASFFNGNASGGEARWFSLVEGEGAGAALTPAGTALSNDFNLPLLAVMGGARPFSLEGDRRAERPPEWARPEYRALRTTLRSLENWYEPAGGAAPAGTWEAGGLVRVVSGADGGGVVVGDFSSRPDFGAAQLTKLCVAGLTRAFMALGAPGVVEGNVPPLPLVAISAPSATSEYKNPSTINAAWVLGWTRWDGQPYTEAYPPGYAGTAAVSYNVKISRDDGSTWQFANARAAAQPGVYSAAYAVAGAGLAWDVSTFPSGEYLFRVEAYRAARPLHYSYHVRRVYIKR